MRLPTVQAALFALVFAGPPCTACVAQSIPRASPALQKSAPGYAPNGRTSVESQRCLMRVNETPELTIKYCSAAINSGSLSGSILASAFNNRGEAHFAKREYDLAIDDYTQAIHLNSELADAFDNRGVAYRIKGNYLKALQDFEQVIRVHPKLAAAA